MFLSEIPNVDMLLDNTSSYVFMVFHTEYHLSDIYIRVKDGSIFITEMYVNKSTDGHEYLLCYTVKSTDH